MINLSSIKELNEELESAAINFSSYHASMKEQRNFYKNSAFYKRKAGDSPMRSELVTNLLRVFADKNIHYTSMMPTFKVPGSPEDRDNASLREKIIYATHRANGTSLKQKKWAKDVTLRSAAIAETTFDLDKRCVKINRYNPERVFWQLSNDGDRRVIAFWAVWPITKDEAIKRYGVTPEVDLIGTAKVMMGNTYLMPIDGKDWFTMAIRWDGKTRTAWIGDKILEEPHEHMMGEIPVDLCLPFDDDDDNAQGAFYLNPLIPLQAELNHTIKQRAAIVQRMANPVVWGRGIMSKQFDDLKLNLSKNGGGFVGLKDKGELGLLQVNDVKLLNEHKADIINDMMRLSGFSNASFGESVGANTSGDALGMYFTPTQKLIDDQNIAWIAFYESINAKILKLYDIFGKTGETFSLKGFAPAGTLMSMANEPDRKMYQQGGAFSIQFDRSVINGDYVNIAIPKPVTPKDEIAEKTFWRDSAVQNVISRTTMYENIGILSPQDELELLKQEQGEPVLNPEGTQKIMQSATDFAQAQQPTALPAATPAPIGVPSGA